MKLSTSLISSPFDYCLFDMQSVVVDDKNVDALYNMLFLPLTIAQIVEFTMIGVGTALVVTTLLYLIICRQRVSYAIQHNSRKSNQPTFCIHIYLYSTLETESIDGL